MYSNNIRNMRHIGKSFLLTFMTIAMLALAESCSETYLDRMWTSNVEHELAIEENAQRVARLQTLCDSLNNAVLSLQTLVKAIDEMDYITGISPICNEGDTIGFRISFKYNESINLLEDSQNGKDGKDGEVPVISIVKTEDGRYCWTVNGVICRDESGNPVCIDGQDAAAPEFKIENGVWKVSYDNGETWVTVGQADGTAADHIFKDILITDSSVRFLLKDGTELTIPRYRKIDIDFDMDGDESGIEAGRSIQVKYTLSYADSQTLITASSDGNYKVQILKESLTEGKILITGPKHYEDGHIVFIVCDGSGHTFSRVINFYEREISFPSGMEFTVPAQGGEVQIPVDANFDYDIRCLDESASEWIDIEVKTRAAIRQYTISLDVKMNKAFTGRIAELGLFARNEPDKALRKIVINQSEAVFHISQDRFVLDAAGKSFTVEVESTSGLLIKSNDVQWLELSHTTDNGINYRLDFSASPNKSGVARSTYIALFSADGTISLGGISITQVTEGEENPDKMIFKVRANSVNDYTTRLPLSGSVDCTVDWGDGSEAEHVTGPLPIHHYKESVCDYTVKIFGTVTSLDSSEITSPSITEVIQWGYTGLKNMNHAFTRNTLLERISDDVNGAFAKVENMEYAFCDCLRLESIPENLFCYCDDIESLSSTFCHCTNIKKIPENLLSGLIKLKNVDNLFGKMTNITAIPEGLFSKNVNLVSFNGVFQGCTKLESLPGRLLANCPEITSFASTFSGCSSLTAIPEDLFYYCPEANHFWQTFCDCSGLTDRELPHSLFDNNRKIRHFQEVFFCCGLCGESPYTLINGRKIHLYERELEPDYFVTPANVNYNRSYVGNNFTDDEQIPSYWKN